jgi:heat shock protein HtpX
MYIIDFFKNLFKKNNVGVIIWMALNLLLITTWFGLALTAGDLGTTVSMMVVGLLLYAVSMMIALSPLGEWILRLQNGCKKITDPEVLARLQPLFEEVYAKAKAETPELSKKVRMFMSEDECPNAFATGRNTVCVTRGLLSYSDEQIKGVLAHEFGHLAHKDTDTILVVAVGNLIVTVVFTVVRVLSNIFMGIGQFFSALFSDSWGGVFASIFIGISRVVADFMLVLLMRLWTQLGVWLCMHSSRKNEFRADAYANTLGYGKELSEVLESFGTEKSAKGLFASLAASHPENADRIAKLKEPVLA